MKLLLMALLALLIWIPAFAGMTKETHALVDPLSSSNNKFGIHIISGTVDELNPAAKLVNSSGGDWGYVTVLIENKDRDLNKWQNLFNEFRKKHLIPIVRLATAPEGNSWKRPYEGEEVAWADFLNNLIWPIKNRYVVVYNEPNHATEWGGAVDPIDYAKTLDKTIKALKSKNPDFFVLNAGFDASAPNQKPNYLDETIFLQEMNQAIPGIFNELDGWSSHSYPNPGFVGEPNDTGRGSIQTFNWELQALRNLGLNKNLPVFITETGWKHSEGQVTDKNLPSTDTVSSYYETAFKNIWNDNRIVAITPFLLDYQQPPFDHFSFKKVTGKESSDTRVLGTNFPEYYPQYQKIMDLQKSTGHPVQENRATLIQGTINQQFLENHTYNIPIIFKNTGQSIWNEYGSVKLTAIDGKELNIPKITIPLETKVEPGQEYAFNVTVNSTKTGLYKLKLALFTNGQQFEGDTFDFDTEVIPQEQLASPSPLPKPNLISQFWKFISNLFNS